MNWKTGLDRYLTSSPYDDGYEDWSERVVESMPEEFYESNDVWLTSCDNLCNEWMNKLFSKGVKPIDAALIIQRGHKLYKL